MAVLVNMNLGDLKRARKTITFTGGAGLGAVGIVTYFSVTGRVLIAMLDPYCSTSLTEAAGTATLALGVTSKATLFSVAVNAVNLDAGEYWDPGGGTPDGVANGVKADGTLLDVRITDDIIATVGAQAVNGGVLEIECLWLPMSANGLLVPA